MGVDIDWQEPASGQSAEQFNLIVATSDLPDIMYYSWATSYPGGPDAAIADGKIVALNDYIEEYAPNFSARLDAHPDVRQEITTDSGNITASLGFIPIRARTAMCGRTPLTVNHMKKASSAWWSARTCWIKRGWIFLSRWTIGMKRWWHLRMWASNILFPARP